MKQPTFRFVKEYANYKKNLFRELAKSFPDKAVELGGRAAHIDQLVNDWERGLILTDELMTLMARA